MKLEGLEKKEIFIYRKKYSFYVKGRKGFGYSGCKSSNATIYVDEDNKVGRYYNTFKTEMAFVYDDNINNYHIVPINGGIGTCGWLYEIGKKSLLIKKNESDKTLSLYDYNANIINKTFH